MKKPNIKKITSISIFAIIAYVLVFGFFICKDIAESFVAGWNAGQNSYNNPVSYEPESSLISILLSFPCVILWFAIIIMSIRMLLNIRKNELPFTEQNGKSLRNIGVFMMLIEPMHIISMISNGYYNSDFAGVIFIVGTLLFCFSSVFRYGVQLQQESDETL